MWWLTLLIVLFSPCHGAACIDVLSIIQPAGALLVSKQNEQGTTSQLQKEKGQDEVIVHVASYKTDLFAL